MEVAFPGDANVFILTVGSLGHIRVLEETDLARILESRQDANHPSFGRCGSSYAAVRESSGRSLRLSSGPTAISRRGGRCGAYE
jgi:hypothetical protein